MNRLSTENDMGLAALSLLVYPRPLGLNNSKPLPISIAHARVELPANCFQHPSNKLDFAGLGEQYRQFLPSQLSLTS